MPQQPTFDVPAGAAAKVSIIDSTLRLSNMKTSYLMTPNLPGLDTLAPLTTWCFLVESPTGKKALFDLGVPPNYDSSFTPAIQTKLRNSGWEVKVEKHVADSLKEGGIDPGSISSVVWRYVSSYGFGRDKARDIPSPLRQGMLTLPATGTGITLETRLPSRAQRTW